ncbi:MAG: inositol-3-phosphate synthase [Candidatus Micrarchaeota archaeon]
MGKIKLGVIGVGNCCSSMLQGLQYYRNIDGNSPPTPGLMHNVISGYKLSSIEVVAAFDIDKRKVGEDVADAAFSKPNCTTKFSDIPKTGVIVKKGPVLDGLAETTKDRFLVDPSQKPCDVKKELRDAGAEVVVSYLPVGSEQAARFYAKEILDAGCAYVNAMPVFITSDDKWTEQFKSAGLPMIGDDVKSVVGATIVHRMLAKLFLDRGVHLKQTYQLNVGGNTDFKNMLERSRLVSKKISKTQAVQSVLKTPLGEDKVTIGPSDYVPWLNDNKIAFIRLEGENFGGTPLTIDMRLDVIDSPNSAGIIVDAVRLCKLGLDRKIGGRLISASAYLMKSPPIQYPDNLARRMVEEFISGERER